MPELPPRYAFRVEDLRVWHEVEAACPNCRHHAVIDHASLTRGRPNHMRLVDLEMKLRCRRCGRRGGRTLHCAPATARLIQRGKRRKLPTTLWLVRRVEDHRQAPSLRR